MLIAGFFSSIGGIAGLFGSIMTIITFITFICKPIRVKFINWLSKSLQIVDLNNRFNDHLVHYEELKERAEDRNKCVYEIKDTLESFIEKSKNDQQISIDIQLCLIRDSILTAYYKYKPLGVIPMYVKENITKQYELYKNLGGNSYVGSLVEELVRIETEM